MNYRQIFGILFFILGVIFIIYPVYSAEAVSLIAGISVMAFGFAEIIDGFSAWSRANHLSMLKILLGICAVIFGFLFVYSIDALSFIVAFQFYLISFVMILIGIIAIILAPDAMSKLAAALIFILGIISFILGVYSLAQPLYVAIFVGLCLIMEGLMFFSADLIDDGSSV